MKIKPPLNHINCVKTISIQYHEPTLLIFQLINEMCIKIIIIYKYCIIMKYLSSLLIRFVLCCHSSDEVPKRSWDRPQPPQANWSADLTCECSPAARPRCTPSASTNQNKYTTIFSDRRIIILMSFMFNNIIL